MKEINIKEIIMSNFGHRMVGVQYKEYASIYEALHSSEYRKVSQRNFDAICEGFNVAEIEFYYISPNGTIPMKVVFNIAFDFEYAERKTYSWDNKREYPCGEKFSVKPVLGVDEIGIELSKMSKVNDCVYKLLWDNIPSGGGSCNGKFIRYCVSGVYCEGHRFEHSKVKIHKRIVDFFNYLFGAVDQACDYQEYPEHKPKIVYVENTSYIDEAENWEDTNYEYYV